MSLETFLFQKKDWGRHNELITLRKPFIEYPLTATTSRLFYDNKIVCTCCFQVMFTETLMKLLVRCLMLLENHFTLTYCSNKFFVTFWKLICSLADTPHWLDDAKECIQSGWSKQRDCWSLTHEMLVALKAVFLENYLTVSTWILNGSPIECLKKKYQPFSLAGVRFGSRVNQISGLKSAWRRRGLCLTYCAATSEF